MTCKEVMTELEKMGSAQTRKTFTNHGAPENMFGVKVGDLKTLVKKIKVDQALASELFATGNSDAMYLAGLIADPMTIKKGELDKWARDAPWYMISEYTVAGVAAESPHGWEKGLKWIDAKKPTVQSAGWATLAGVLAIKPDDELDLAEVEELLARVENTIDAAANRVRYAMNGFVIAVGCYVKPMNKRAMKAARSIGKVEVSMGKTSCKVPFAPEYIDKVVGLGRLGRKRKQVRC